MAKQTYFSTFSLGNDSRDSELFAKHIMSEYPHLDWKTLAKDVFGKDDWPKSWPINPPDREAVILKTAARLFWRAVERNREVEFYTNECFCLLEWLRVHADGDVRVVEEAIPVESPLRESRGKLDAILAFARSTDVCLVSPGKLTRYTTFWGTIDTILRTIIEELTASLQSGEKKRAGGTGRRSKRRRLNKK